MEKLENTPKAYSQTCIYGKISQHGFMHLIFLKKIIYLSTFKLIIISSYLDM